MTAVSGDQLQESGTTNVAELVRDVPGVAAKSGGPGQTVYTIRGLSSSAGVAPTVGFYLDEIPVTPPAIAAAGKASLDPDLYDISRVELLRGPQGTLYGASSMGGTIKVVPNSPRLNRLEGSGQAVFSSTEGGGPNGTVNAMLNTPLVKDLAALRVVVTKKHESGWIDRVVASPFPLADDQGQRGDVAAAPVIKAYRKANDADLEGVRASILIQPIAGLSIVPGYFHQRLKQGAADTYDAQPGSNAHYQPFDIAEPFEDSFGVASLKVTYDLGFATLTSATAYAKRDRRQSQDTSEIMQRAFGLPGYEPDDGGLGPIVTEERNPTRQLTQELRLASNDAGPLRWLVGAFYSRFDSHYRAQTVGPEAEPVIGTTNFYTADYGDLLVQRALFGNLSYDITADFKVTTGLRYFTSRSHSTIVDSGLFASGVADPSDADAKGVTPMLNLAYNLDRDSMFYATAAKGFRDGAAQHGVPLSLCGADLAALGLDQAPGRYGPDTVWSFELGSKNRFLDRRLTVNAAIYQQRWADVQKTVVLPCGYTYTANAATAEATGFELELGMRFGTGFSFEQSMGYTHARYAANDPLSNTKKGDKMEGVPEWTASTGLRYAQAINDDLGFVGRFGINYSSDTLAVTDARKAVPGYALMNVRAAVEADAWTVSLFVDNLANRKVALTNTQSLSINTPSLDRVATSRPRTVGIDVSVRF